MYWHVQKLLLATAWLFTPSVGAFSYPSPEISGKISPRKPPANIHKLPDKAAPDSDTFYQKSCGLDVPTNVGWHAGIKDNFTKWTYENFDAFINSGQKSFPLFLRNKFAPNAVPSSQYCDGIGSCTIGSCLNLDTTLSKDQQQLAYYGFEKLANIVHTHKVVYQVVDESLEYFLGRVNELVEDFSSAKRLQRIAVERERTNAVIQSAVTMFLLVASSALSAGAAGVGASAGAGLVSSTIGTTLKISAPTSGMVTSLYIGIGGLANTMTKDYPNNIRDNKNLLEDLQKALYGVLNELRHNVLGQINSDMSKLMEGDVNAQKQDIYNLLVSDDFIEADTTLKARLKADFEKYFFAVFIDAIWGIDRPYIVDTNAQEGACEFDARGAIQNRVCLPENPGRTYWLYSLDRGEEFDHFTNDQVKVKGPTGYRNFYPDKNKGYYNLTMQSIVRSSLVVHALPDDLQTSPDILSLIKHWDHGDPTLSEVPGAFAVPICRNPGGEAISSVWGKRSRNYPCMCGEFGWKNWNEQLDETRRFLDRTGFKWSEDFDDYCRDHNKCSIGKKHHRKHWGFEPPKGKKIGDKHVHVVQHKYLKCKKPLNHKHIGHPDRDLKG